MELGSSLSNLVVTPKNTDKPDRFGSIKMFLASVITGILFEKNPSGCIPITYAYNVFQRSYEHVFPMVRLPVRSVFGMTLHAIFPQIVKFQSKSTQYYKSIELRPQKQLEDWGMSLLEKLRIKMEEFHQKNSVKKMNTDILKQELVVLLQKHDVDFTEDLNSVIEEKSPLNGQLVNSDSNKKSASKRKAIDVIVIEDDDTTMNADTSTWVVEDGVLVQKVVPPPPVDIDLLQNHSFNTTKTASTSLTAYSGAETTDANLISDQSWNGINTESTIIPTLHSEVEHSPFTETTDGNLFINEPCNGINTASTSIPSTSHSDEHSPFTEISGQYGLLGNQSASLANTLSTAPTRVEHLSGTQTGHEPSHANPESTAESSSLRFQYIIIHSETPEILKNQININVPKKNDNIMSTGDEENDLSSMSIMSSSEDEEDDSDTEMDVDYDVLCKEPQNSSPMKRKSYSYICSICQVVLETVSNLREHLKSKHSYSKLYPCRHSLYCTKSKVAFALQSDLINHKKMDHAKRPLRKSPESQESTEIECISSKDSQQLTQQMDYSALHVIRNKELDSTSSKPPALGNEKTDVDKITSVKPLVQQCQERYYKNKKCVKQPMLVTKKIDHKNKLSNPGVMSSHSGKIKLPPGYDSLNVQPVVMLEKIDLTLYKTPVMAGSKDSTPSDKSYETEEDNGIMSGFIKIPSQQSGKSIQRNKTQSKQRSGKPNQTLSQQSSKIKSTIKTSSQKCGKLKQTNQTASRQIEKIKQTSKTSEQQTQLQTSRESCIVNKQKHPFSKNIQPNCSTSVHADDDDDDDDDDDNDNDDDEEEDYDNVNGSSNCKVDKHFFEFRFDREDDILNLKPQFNSKHQMLQTMFTCPHCDIIFPDMAMYLTHRNMHAKNNPFQCRACDKKFRNKYEFQRHWHS